jgi:hypothetical protein
MRNNPCLKAVLTELGAAGVPYQVRRRGHRHLQIRWAVNGTTRLVVVSATPSSPRAAWAARTSGGCYCARVAPQSLPAGRATTCGRRAAGERRKPAVVKARPFAAFITGSGNEAINSSLAQRARDRGASPARAGNGGDGWRRELEELALRLGRLSPSWKDPEQFAVERSELVAQLRRLARAMEKAS